MDEQEKKEGESADKINENKEETDRHNRQLKLILIITTSIILIVLFAYLIVDSIRHFNYNGLKFDAVKEKDLLFYQTSLPLYSSITGKHVADYNIYLRNDPRKLKDIQIKGEISSSDLIYINMTEEFSCDGDGVIAIANLVQSFEIMGIDIKKNANAICDSQGRYTFVQIQAGNETSIEQFGNSCYKLNVNNCEILKVTERFLVETIAENQDTKFLIDR